MVLLFCVTLFDAKVVGRLFLFFRVATGERRQLVLYLGSASMLKSYETHVRGSFRHIIYVLVREIGRNFFEYHVLSKYLKHRSYNNTCISTSFQAEAFHSIFSEMSKPILLLPISFDADWPPICCY